MFENNFENNLNRCTAEVAAVIVYSEHLRQFSLLVYFWHVRP